MEKLEEILTVGFKKGEATHSIRSTISELSFEQMNEFRIMTMVAIGVAEDMWRRSKEQQTYESDN